MKSSTRQTLEDDLHPNAVEHLEFGDVYYDIFNHDAQVVHKVVPMRPYTLALANIPYGFGMVGCLLEDAIPWGMNEITKMVQSFKIVTNGKLWRIIVHHSLDQYEAIKILLKTECNGGFQNCVW